MSHDVESTANLQPGDVIESRVKAVGQNEFTLQLQDKSQGDVFIVNTTVTQSPSAGTLASAEWIVEAPQAAGPLGALGIQLGAHTVALANFSHIHLANCKFNVSSTPTDTSGTEIDMVDGANRLKAQPSHMTTQSRGGPYPGANFDVTWFGNGGSTAPSQTAPGQTSGQTGTPPAGSSGSTPTPPSFVCLGGSSCSTPTPAPPTAAPDSPAIGSADTYTQGVYVYVRVLYTDNDGDAQGFGFRGVNGSGWAEETHPFSGPSYGSVSGDASAGTVVYPFNSNCGSANEQQSDVEFWIYDNGASQSNSAVVHLACSTSGGSAG
jgi:hypothetical protein